jgi:hypothetical protein
MVAYHTVILELRALDSVCKFRDPMGRSCNSSQMPTNWQSTSLPYPSSVYLVKDIVDKYNCVELHTSETL